MIKWIIVATLVMVFPIRDAPSQKIPYSVLEFIDHVYETEQECKQFLPRVPKIVVEEHADKIQKAFEAFPGVRGLPGPNLEINVMCEEIDEHPSLRNFERERKD